MLKNSKILLAATSRWFAVARLTMALKNIGFAVEVVCPRANPVAKTSAVQRVYAWNGLFPYASLRSAILTARPEIVIPCDDLARNLLHGIYWSSRRRHPSGSWITALLEHSLGDPEGYPVADARSSLIALAGKEGIRVPKSTIVQSMAQLKAWIVENGLPATLKTDGSSGGVGVKIVHTLEEAERTFASLHTPPLVARVVKRAVMDHDVSLFMPCLLRRRPQVNVQTFIRGQDATMAVACWQGKVLAALCFDVLHVWEAKGPASVLRWKDNSEMSSAAETIAARLKLSGLYGFDFMIEEGTGNAYLIEMNPRATQTSHLPLGTGRDLPAALWSALSGEPLRSTPRITDNDTIALFPQEWQRNPSSTFLSTAYHDVPWEEPKLVRACIQSRRPGSAFAMEMLSAVYPSATGHRVRKKSLMHKSERRGFRI